MDSADLIQNVIARAQFQPDAMTKTDCFRTDRLFVGLNCLEPGQAQRVHTHAGSDKFYFVVSGTVRMQIGAAVSEVGPGSLVFAPAGMAHGVEEALERTVMLVALAPPPNHR